MVSEENIAKKREQLQVVKPNVVAYGHLSTDYRDYVLGACKNSFFINWSSILTRLIQLAGQYCDQYASDLFILWNEFVRKFNSSDWDAIKHTVYGFRGQGVDQDETVYKNAADNMYYYRRMAAVDVDVSETGDIVMKMQVF